MRTLFDLRVPMRDEVEPSTGVVRGRADSGGDFHFYFGEGEDGYDTIEWIAQQPWIANQTVFHDRDRSSHILLPVLPTGGTQPNRH